MANTGNLQSDQLFKGLTRPPMLLGVSFSFAILNMSASLITYVVTSKLTMLFVVMPGLHLLGYVICFSEPLFVDLFIIRSQKCNKCKNKFYHGANSYDAT